VLASGLTERIDSQNPCKKLAYEWGGGGQENLTCNCSISEVYLYLQAQRNKIPVTSTAHSVLYYWILIVTLCNVNFIPRFLCLRFTCILMLRLSGQSGMGQVKDALRLSTSFWQTTWLVNSGQQGPKSTERFLAIFTAVLQLVNQVLSPIFIHLWERPLPTISQNGACFWP
jgi:hypothetical protein